MIHAALMDAVAVSSWQRVLLHLLNVIEWRANGNHIDKSNQMLGKGGQGWNSEPGDTQRRSTHFGRANPRAGPVVIARD